MPGWLTGLTYLEPERLDPSEARARALQSSLDKIAAQRRRLEFERVALSPANKFHLQNLKNFEAKFSDEIEARRKRVVQLKKAGADPALTMRAISRLSNLLSTRGRLQQRADAERRRNARSAVIAGASAGDRRFYFPGSQFFRNPRSVFGTEAVIRVLPSARHMYRHALLSIPCIQRVVRREVLFARGQARGHRSRKRRGPLSHIGC